MRVLERRNVGTLLTSGDPAAPFLIIYEAPHAEDLRLGKCLVDGYGQSFWRIAKKCGIDRTDCYVVPTVGESCESGKSAGLWNDWWDEYDAAVGRWTGRVAICLGSDAFYRATGLSGSHQDWAGYLIHPDERGELPRRRTVADVYKSANKKRGIKKGDPRQRVIKEKVVPSLPPSTQFVITTQSPGGLWRSGLAQAPLMVSALEKAVRAARGTLRPSREDFSTTPAPITANIFALDLEGTESIECVGIATADSAWTAPWDFQSRAYVAEALANPDNLVIIHNANFDIPFLERAGVEVKCKVFDTMIGAAFCNPDLRKGLAACGSLWLDCYRWKPPRSGEPTGSQRLDTQSEERYNALDTIREYELYLVELAEMQQRGQVQLFETMMRTLRTLIRMQQRGIGLDPLRQGEWLAKLRLATGELAMKWAIAAPNVSFNSHKQLKTFFKSKGISLPPNKKGSDSTDREALYLIKARQPEHAPLVDLLVEVRKAHKDLATYAKVAALGDGRVHPSFALISKDEDGLGKELAGTFRITAKEPNLQNQTEEAQKMYVPRPGHCFVAADYSSLEARLFAALSKDALLTEDIAANIHDINSKRLGIDRVRAKNGFYGWAYGSGAKTLYMTFMKHGYKVPMADCQALLDMFAGKYTTATAWRQALISVAESNRYVQNSFGYIREFHEYEFPKTKVVNTRIQSDGAFMMWERLWVLDEELSNIGANLLLMVHDNVLAECPIELRDQTARIIKSVMELEFDNIAPGFSCPVDVKWSDKSWGEMEKLHV